MTKRGIIQVGAGSWGQSWLPFIHESKEWELAALVSRGGENLRKAREKWNIPAERCFATLEEALKGPGDVVLITAPHELHVPMALKALEAGKRALIEKPLSDDFEAARRLANFAAECGRGAWVAQNFRYRSGLWQLRRSLGQGTLGKAVCAHLRFRRGGPQKQPSWPQEWRQRQWSFLLNEIIIHHFDMFRFLLGQDAEWVWCQAWKAPWLATEGPESAAAVVGMAGGALLDYSGSIRALCGPVTKFEGDWVLQTDRGCASWSGDEVAWDLAKGETGQLLDAAGFPGFDRAGVLRDLAEAVEGRPTAALPTVKDNLRSLAMVFAAIRSLKEGRRVELREFLEAVA